ncbi:MAG: hypothetical protein KDA16_11900 [Phycisphaerales bacterium]|nr:hypothetical protein [Phycisphaerales bacterium]
MSNRTAIGVLLVILAAGVVAACASWDFGDLVSVKTPQALVDTGMQSKMSLNEAEYEYHAWFTGVQMAGAKWKADIERADEVAGLFGALTMNALTAGEGAIASGAPWAVPFLPILTGIIGAVAIRKPGDTSKSEAETKANTAWDEAFKAGVESVKAGVAVAKSV